MHDDEIKVPFMKYAESNRVELKRELTDSVKNAIIAFLNTRGGTVYVGVNDDGTVSADFKKANRDEADKKIGNWLIEAFYPVPSDLVEYSYNEDGVLAINVKEGDKKPYYLKGKGPKPSGVYRRIGSSTRKATEDEILMMIMHSHDYVYESAVSEEQELTFAAIGGIFAEKGLKWDDRIMVSLGLKNKKDEFTNLAYILSDQSPIVIKFAEYDEERNFLQKRNLSGSLVKTLYEVEALTQKINRTVSIINGATFERIEKKSYPGASLRETILNAFCHADYFVRSNIKIEFFTDQARITSPGGIYNATMADIMKGVQTYRNPRLVHVFDKLGLIENYGTGIPRTFDAYKGSERDPIFESTDNFFFVTLPNLNYESSDEIKDEISDEIKDEINDTGLAIIKIIAEHPGIKVPAILSELVRRGDEITVNQVRNEIRRNLDEYIEYRGSKKTGGYYLKKRRSNGRSKIHPGNERNTKWGKRKNF